MRAGFVKFFASPVVWCEEVTVLDIHARKIGKDVGGQVNCS